MTLPIVFFWENYGPMHVDRVEAVVGALPNSQVFGVEFRSASDTYEWKTETWSFEKNTLFEKGKEPKIIDRIGAIWSSFRKIGRGHYFLCHYNWAEVFIVAWLLRLTGSKVYAMGCSKIDDKPRSAFREFLKSFYLMPYHGAIASGKRSKDYSRFLGIPKNKIFGEYNTVSINRFRDMANIKKPFNADAHEGRYFISVARFVPKKNHKMLIDAYNIYQQSADKPRGLHLCGSGELEAEIRDQIRRLGLEKLIVFHGFLQTKEISKILAKSLTLLLPSIEEQFGNVVIEAQALALPVIVSEICGARDKLVQSGVNGFIIEADNPEGLAYFMQLLSENSQLWAQMSKAAFTGAEKGDVVHFSRAVKALIGQAK